jgi:hypothetical protein
MAMDDAAPKPNMTNRVAIEYSRTHPPKAVQASIIAAKVKTPQAIDRTACMVSEKPGSRPREVMGKTTWVKNPMTAVAISSGPTARRLRLRPANAQSPTASAARSTLWAVMTASITGRTGDPRAVSSLIHWSLKL